MTTTILFAHRLTAVEEEIAHLQTLMDSKRAQIGKIQPLLTQASFALHTIHDAANALPKTLIHHLEKEIVHLLNLENPIQIPYYSDKNQELSSEKREHLDNQQQCDTETAVTPSSRQENLWQAAQSIHALFHQKEKITTKHLQQCMSAAFGGSDAIGLWQWKEAYEALEIALVQYLKKQPKLILENILALENRYPTHTRRSEESLARQQFSTPLPLGYIATQAAMLTPEDIVLESSVGNGFLAIWAEKAGAKLILNELAESRRSTLAQLFPNSPLFGHNGEQIHNYLESNQQPTVALLNPPFCTSPNMVKRHGDATFHHLYSALERLPQGGRLVAITAQWFAPDNPKWNQAFTKLQQLGTIVFNVSIDGRLYKKQGTTINTRLIVIDKVEAAQSCFTTSQCCDNAHELLKLVRDNIPPRSYVSLKPNLWVKAAQGQEVGSESNTHRDSLNLGKTINSDSSRIESEEESSKLLNQTDTAAVSIDNTLTVPAKTIPSLLIADSKPTINWQQSSPLSYSKGTNQSQTLSDALYQAYKPQTITIDRALDHPTPLVQSTAMASVMPPMPSYQPILPQEIITQGILSAPQLESIIYAGQAHSQMLSGHFLVDDSREKIKITAPETEKAVQFRRGWLLGDGTGAGKGRQAAGIILDNWLQGRKKALWISKSDKLIEDARRDWIALGGDKNQILSLQKFRSGQPIELSEGILFATYALLRMKGKQGKISRIEQLINWLGKDFDGVIIFDECHAMGSALASQSNRGQLKPSQQGLAGLRLQYSLPSARIVYVSATGATKVSNLAYATRLGLWQSADFPFASQMDFIGSVEQGGLAAMEVVSRDLKSLGLYASRSLSYQGVE